MKSAVLALSSLAAIVSAAEVTSTAAGQKSLNLTVYNSNRALVSQTRSVDLPSGIASLRYSDIASQVMPQTVIVESAKGVSVLEQNYEFDLISQEKLMEKYVGKEVTIIQENPYTGKSETKTATLLANNGSPVFQMDGKILLGMPGRIVLPELPGNLYAKPTMNWLVNSAKGGEKELALSYLTGGIGWNADYVLNLAEDDKSASITGWVTLTNNAGTDFTDAKLKLVAGDVNVVQQNYGGRGRMEKEMVYASAPMADIVQEKEFFEYHLYTFPRPVTVRNNQVKQLSLLTAEGIKTQKKYRVAVGADYYGTRDGKSEHPVNVEIAFKTGKDNQIDMPIPEGTIRLYKKDSDGSSVFVGEDRVKHTPINEEISLKTGDAFDIKAESRQMSYERINNRASKSSYEVELRNHKKEAVTVEVTVPVNGEWKVTAGPTFRKLNATMIAFDVAVPASGKAQLNYTVEVKW